MRVRYIRRTSRASIMGSATFCFSRWTQRRGCQLHRCHNCPKHCARLLTEKAFCCRRPVRPGKEKVVNGGATLPLARPIESSPLMAAEGYGAMSPLHIGTGALAYRCPPLGLVMELVLGLTTQCTHGPTGFKPRGAPPLGKLAQRCAIADGARPGDAIEIGRRDQLGVHRTGDQWRQDELSDLLLDRTGDERDS